MPKTIGNPLSWGVDAVGAAGKHIGSVAETVGSEHDAQIAAMPEIRRIDYGDLQTALRGGFKDFLEARSDVAFLVLLYPVIGLVMSWIAFNRELFPLIFPVMSGFALLGPVAAVGVYEISRKREFGRERRLARRVRGPEVAVVRGDLRAGAVPVCSLRGLADGCARHLGGDARSGTARLDRRLSRRGLRHAGGLDDDPGRLRRRPPVRRGGAFGERGVVSAPSRPQCGAAGGGGDLDPRGEF